MMHGTNISWKSKKSPSQNIIKKISFRLQQGRITTFLGKSGAGKTTLLKCISHIYSDYEGTLTYRGHDVKNLVPSERASKIGYVLQQFHLFPHFSVLKNCTYALEKVQNIDIAHAEEKAREMLSLLNMDAFISSYPNQLSGGQQQRVALARALVLNPDLLLLDEPTSALDPESKQNLINILFNLNKKGITIALSSHDMPFVKKMKDVVYFMEHGELIEEWDQTIQPASMPSKIHQFLEKD